jgi:hypothetical protein
MKPEADEEVVRGGGKADALLHAFANLSPGHKTGIVHVTTRDEVESLDTSRFLATFGPKAGRKQLRRLRANVHFTVAGYDGTDAELYEIPEVRKFYRRIHRLQPAWPFFARLDCPCLFSVFLCLMPNFTVLRSGGLLRVIAHPAECLQMLQESVEHTFRLDRAAGIPPHGTVKRLTDTARYLGID